MGMVRAVATRVRGLVRRPADVARRGAGRAADSDRLPTSLRAVLGYYADGHPLDLDALRLKPRVERSIEGMVEAAFDPVRAALAEEFDRDPDAVTFDYETKLLLPATLTLARCYRAALEAAPDGFDPVDREVRPGVTASLGIGDHARGEIASEFSPLVRDVDRAEDATRLVVAALLDGDMRDAINDDEYDDFETNVASTPEGRRRVARIAQSTLQERVERGFERYPDGVREAYDRAVARSEAHQARDEGFRSLLSAAREDNPGARGRIREEYRDAGFEDPPEHFDRRDLDLPYFRTQYDRVGVIYDGMLDMYREVGIDLDDAFRRSIVLSIVGAQVWLDDVDDFAADMRDGQLTPVTAEYLLADDERAAHRRVVEVVERYLDAAGRYAAASDSTLTGIAVEYVRQSGDPAALPGSDG